MESGKSKIDQILSCLRVLFNHAVLFFTSNDLDDGGHLRHNGRT